MGYTGVGKGIAAGREEQLIQPAGFMPDLFPHPPTHHRSPHGPLHGRHISHRIGQPGEADVGSALPAGKPEVVGGQSGQSPPRPLSPMAGGQAALGSMAATSAGTLSQHLMKSPKSRPARDSRGQFVSSRRGGSGGGSPAATAAAAGGVAAGVAAPAGAERAAGTGKAVARVAAGGASAANVGLGFKARAAAAGGVDTVSSAEGFGVSRRTAVGTVGTEGAEGVGQTQLPGTEDHGLQSVDTHGGRERVNVGGRKGEVVKAGGAVTTGAPEGGRGGAGGGGGWGVVSRGDATPALRSSGEGGIDGVIMTGSGRSANSGRPGLSVGPTWERLMEMGVQPGADTWHPYIGRFMEKMSQVTGRCEGKEGHKEGAGGDVCKATVKEEALDSEGGMAVTVIAPQGGDLITHADTKAVVGVSSGTSTASGDQTLTVPETEGVSGAAMGASRRQGGTIESLIEEVGSFDEVSGELLAAQAELLQVLGRLSIQSDAALQRIIPHLPGERREHLTRQQQLADVAAYLANQRELKRQAKREKKASEAQAVLAAAAAAVAASPRIAIHRRDGDQPLAVLRQMHPSPSHYPAPGQQQITQTPPSRVPSSLMPPSQSPYGTISHLFGPLQPLLRRQSTAGSPLGQAGADVAMTWLRDGKPVAADGEGSRSAGRGERELEWGGMGRRWEDALLGRRESEWGRCVCGVCWRGEEPKGEEWKGRIIICSGCSVSVHSEAVHAH